MESITYTASVVLTLNLDDKAYPADMTRPQIAKQLSELFSVIAAGDTVQRLTESVVISLSDGVKTTTHGYKPN